jgi:hypothetical protein
VFFASQRLRLDKLHIRSALSNGVALAFQSGFDSASGFCARPPHNFQMMDKVKDDKVNAIRAEMRLSKINKAVGVE